MATRGGTHAYSDQAAGGQSGKAQIERQGTPSWKKAPSCPKWLEPEAKTEWSRLSEKI